VESWQKRLDLDGNPDHITLVLWLYACLSTAHIGLSYG